MKNIAFTLLFILLSFSQLVGNPIPPPPVISEIYFEGINWTIELAYGEEWPDPLPLDECTLISSAGETTFNEGTVLFPDSILLITEDDITTPLFIDKDGDFLMIVGSFIYEEVYFGDYSGSHVNAPYDNQSLARVTFGYQWYWQGYPEWVTFYRLAKENIPSLGGNIYSVNTSGTFCGYVYDLQGYPISNAKIYYFSSPNYEAFLIETSDNGYFEKTYMCGFNYDVTIYVDDISMLDTLITIEPDSTTYCEFYIDLTSADEEIGQYNQIILSNYPNPFIESTTISFDLATKSHKNTQINIYNAKGQLIRKFLPVAHSPGHPVSVIWDGKNESNVLQPPGFYFYSLEVDGKKVKTNKMIMVR